MGETAKVVRARKQYECIDRGERIPAGDLYLSIVATPRYEFNPNPGKWTRAAACRRCSDGHPAWNGFE